MLTLIHAIQDPVMANLIEELFRQSKDALLAYSESIVREPAAAEDVVQSAFQIIVDRPQLLKYDEASRNRAYMMAIVRNLALNYLRDHRKEIPAEMEPAAAGPSLDELLIQKEAFLYAEAVISQLPKNYQDAIFLKYEMDYSHEEISRLLGISYDNVRQRMSRGLRRARAELEKGGVALG